MKSATLYKYLSPQRVDVLQNLKIRFTQVSALNDPFESLPGATLESVDWYRNHFQQRVVRELSDLQAASRAERRAYERKRNKDFTNFLKCYTDQHYLSELSEKVQRMSNAIGGCLSLTANCTNILMWSHYSLNHTGFVIGFNAEHEFFGDSVAPVVYSKTRPKVNPFEARHDGILFYTKSDDWSYEEEHRKYIDFVDSEPLLGGNSFLPYNEKLDGMHTLSKLHLEPIPPEAISCIIVGWKSTDSLRTELYDACKKHSLSRLPIRRARPSLTEYSMDIAVSAERVVDFWQWRPLV